MRVRERLERERLNDPSVIFGNQSFIRVRERLEPFVIRERLVREKLRTERVRIKETKRLTILEVENGKCRWPVGRAKHGTQEHLFCGNDVTIPRKGCKPRVYCDWHHAKAHTRMPEMRMAG